MITTNIDFEEGLANGVVGKLSHIELGDQNRALRAWLLFPNGISVKVRGKVAGCTNSKRISTEMVHINRGSAKFLSTEVD
ncbi:hypothetical protein TNIN_33331 [Trichonephila inaurata madagascariensis]|uniref:Uncharacterized protein n=1 Tax=Trichonephila inaurata madagascariensis TaxID=2747483 RepID=A0A8X6WN73_9ARAC|nr:hypothetical protein TNIN_33331 [Trichonephila inaurata madagascariensis]